MTDDAPARDGRLTVVVGITGGIAAYKAVSLVRSLVLGGHDVHVVPTEGALRFVGRPTLEAISRHPVTSDVWDGVAEVRHVALGRAADVVVIAPATADALARLAAGLAPDLLGTTVLASSAPLVLAPAMHTEMWHHPATRANMETLRGRGAIVVGPGTGRLTGADSGEGRMAEPDEIERAVLAAASARSGPGSVDRAAGDLAARRVVVSAGGTREPLDPVRFLGNRSSGRQGVALAHAARARGAEVVLVAAHLEVAPPDGVEVVTAGTAAELGEAVRSAARTADVVIMAAAVADFRPADVAASKIKKDDGGGAPTIELVRNPDVLKGLGDERRETGSTRPLLVGFAAETEPDDVSLVALAAAKARAKGADLVVANRVGDSLVFGRDDTSVVVVDADGEVVARADGGKASVADRILDVVAARLAPSTG